MIIEIKENYLQYLSQILRQSRENAGVTQMELAEELGVSLRTYQRLEKGESEPTLSQIYNISRILRVPMDFFIYSSSTLKHFGIGRWEYSEKNKQLHACEATFEIYDLDPKEKVTEKILLEKIHLDDLERFRNHFKKNENQKTIYDIEYRITTRNGEKWILQKCLNIFDHQGQKIKRIGFAFDISKLKNMPTQHS